jgi:thymidine kinase
MAKLYFRYGTVGSAKTLNLLAVAHNYQQQNKKVCLLKPKLDTRFGTNEVTSRAGLSKKADVLITNETIFGPQDFNGTDCLVVDEAQFLSTSVIDQFRMISSIQNIPVICYGLRTDFRGQLFEGSRRLFEVADSIEEIKTTCAYCNRKGVFNLKLVDGKPTVSGPTIELGTEERYVPTCSNCYRDALENQYVHQKSEDNHTLKPSLPVH